MENKSKVLISAKNIKSVEVNKIYKDINGQRIDLYLEGVIIYDNGHEFKFKCQDYQLMLPTKEDLAQNIESQRKR